MQESEFSVATRRGTVSSFVGNINWGYLYGLSNLLNVDSSYSLFFSCDYGKHWVCLGHLINMYTAERDEIKFNPIQAFEMELNRLWPRLRSWYIRRTVFRDPWF